MNAGGPNAQRVVIRPRAVADIEHHAEYLDANAPPGVAQRFRSAVMKAVERVGAMPIAGSPRETRNPRLSGLRMWMIPGFRHYLLHYLVAEEAVEIIRLFHAAQDITGSLEDEE